MDIDDDAGAAPRDQKTVRHKTLSAYYSRLLTLESYLSGLDGVLYHSDPDEYRHLVTRAMCAPHNTRPVPPFDGVDESQQRVIDGLLDDLRGSKDVLLNGAANRYSAYDNSTRAIAQNLHVGSASSILRGQTWEILRSRIGDAAFRHVFLNTSIFLALGNNCFMQLCGRPVHDMYDEGKRAAGAKRAGDDAGNARKKPKLTGGSAAGTNLSRQRIYYGRAPRTAHGKLMYGLPKKHILNKVKPTDDPSSHASVCASIDLLLDMFPSIRSTSVPAVSDGPWDRVKGNKRRVEAMLPVMHKIIMRHRKMDYRAMLTRCLKRLDDVNLDTYPKLPVAEGKEKMSWVSKRHKPKAPREPVPSLKPISHSQVCRFLTSVLRRLLPVVVLGSEDNFLVLANRARMLVQSKMYEPLSVHTLVQGLRINDFTWLALGVGPRVPPQEATKRRQLVGEFMYWLFEQFLIPLLRASFYATETATTRYETVYYSHDAWANATEPHLKKLQGTLLEELEDDQHHLASGPLGVSAVRLIPKPAGFRPIVNLGRSTGTQAGGHSRKGLSANQVLRDVHQVLTFEKNRKRASLGSCLFGTNEIFAPLRDLKQELLRQHRTVPKLFFVKMDIKAAFDTIKQDKVLQVVEKMLDKDYDYVLMLYALLLPPASKASHAAARRLFKSRAVVADHNLAKIDHHVEVMAEPMRNAVIVDLFRRQEISREGCMELLRTHIQKNVWQIGDQYFRQKTGIPQGSKISSLLCSFFYSLLEAEHLSWTRRPGTRLLRYIDDFLLITDDYGVARRFVHTMSKGFPEYGAFVSPSKTLLSFELAPGGQAAPVASVVTCGSCYFPYCGFLINTRTLDFSIDLERLMAGPTRQSFALRTNRRRGGNFVGWLSRQLENRNHTAYLDTDHNDKETVYLNVFCNFAQTALKIPYYFTEEVDHRRSQLVFAWICLSAEYTYTAGRARVRHAARGCSREHFAVSHKAFVFIAKSAMYLALSHRPSRVGRVVHLLKEDLDKRENKGVAARVGSIVDRGWEMVRRRM